MRALRVGLSALLFSASVSVSAKAQETGTPATANTSEPQSPEPPVSEAPAAPTLVVSPATLPAPAVVEESIDPSMLAAANSAQLSPEELERLGFGGSAPSVDTSIKMFGFADFTFSTAPQKPNNPWREELQPHSSFYVGNFNLYLSKNLSENVRTMGEVRFLYAPHGSPNDDGSYTVTSARDVTDLNRPVHWGGIMIERLYLEWTIHPYLAVRAGQFLTPYGIWNVDHGSPLFIPVTRPYVIGSQLFPERQTGLEFFGQYDFNAENSLGYHFTISNGMGPIAEIRDLDENKGVGSRVFWENRTLGTLRVGGSAFYAKDTSSTNVQSLDTSGRLTTTTHIEAQSKVLSLAADVQWKYKGIHLQAEVITQQRKFANHGRVASTNPFSGNPIFPEDYLSWGVYGIAGYGFDVWRLNIMPYIQVQSFDQIDPTFIKSKTNGVTAGVNIRPIDAVVVKLAYTTSKWPDGFIVSDGSVQLLQAQVAWAF